MKFKPLDVYDVLVEHDIDYIFHANSVVTSCHYLTEGALLSRGLVEEECLYQTPQISDAKDKRLKIWNDVFADPADLHKLKNDVNFYGPVLFVLDSKIVKKFPGKISITRTNPIRWLTSKPNWFKSLDEWEASFNAFNYKQMIVFRGNGGRVTFGRSLKKIIVDDPQLMYGPKRKNDAFSIAYGALRYAMQRNDSKVPIYRRKCKLSCDCRRSYQAERAESRVKYMPHEI